MKKRIAAVVLCAVLALSLSACGSGKSSGSGTEATSAAERPVSDEKSLYQHGLAIIAVMDEMVRSEEYRSMMSAGGEVGEVAVRIAAGDYTQPQAAYRIVLSDDLLDTVYAAVGEDAGELDKLSDALKNDLNRRMSASISTQINARFGASCLAAASVYTASSAFVSGEPETNLLYVYAYRDAYPVLISFVRGESGAVTASGAFLLDDDFHADSAEAVQAYLREASMYLPDAVAEPVAE